MIYNSPEDFLSLHRNIQYYNTHRDKCFINGNLSIVNNDPNNKDLPELFFNKVQEFYDGSSRDDKWLQLVKADLAKLKITGIAECINKIEQLQKTTPKGPKPVDWLKLGISNVVTIFDHAIKDDNGAMRHRVYSAIRSPDNLLIMPKAVFTNASKEGWVQYMAGQDLVMLEQKNSGFLVLVPKKLLKTPEDLPLSLAYLDLNPEQLQQVTLDEIYSTKDVQKSPPIEQWEHLWSNSCQLKKRWYFAGHGASNANKKDNVDEKTIIVALKEPDFMKLIQAVKKQKTEIIYFESCHVGRTIPESQLQFFTDCDFPVMLEGRVDTVTYAIHLDDSLFWLGIHDFLKNKSHGIKSTQALKNHLSNYRKELPEFETSKPFSFYENQPALLSPHSLGSPVGFKTVEGPCTKNVQTISYGDVRSAQLQSLKPFTKDPKPSEITIPKEKNILELYPPVIDVTLRLEKADMKIHSMIPGKAQHYIKKIVLESGEAKEFFNTIIKGYKNTVSPKGLFIESLVSETDKLKNISILLCPGQEEISYFDISSGENKIITFDHTLPQLETASQEDRWTSTVQTLIKIHPFFPETVSLSTGGQAERGDVFQLIKENFRLEGANELQLEKFYSLVSALRLEKTDLDFIKEIELMPTALQMIVVNLLVEIKKDPKLFKSLLDKGLINENNWELVQQLPEKDRLELYDLLIKRGKIKETDITNIVTKRIAWRWVGLIVKYVENQQDLTLALAKTIYEWLSPMFAFAEDREQLFPILGRKEILSQIDLMEFCKKFSSDSFDSIKVLIEKAIEHNEKPDILFTDMIPVMLEKGFSNGLEWILSFNGKHKFLEEKACHELIKEGCMSLLQKLPMFSFRKTEEAVVKLIWKVRGLVSLDELTLISHCLNSDPSLFMCKNLISESILKANPEIRPLVLKTLSTVGFNKEVDTIEYLDQLFVFTEEEKKQLLNALFMQSITKTDMVLFQKISTWLNLINENEKQELLRDTFNWAFTSGPITEAIIKKLISLGMDIQCKEFEDVFGHRLGWLFCHMSQEFILDRMKTALNQVPDERLKKTIKDWDFSKLPSAEVLNYLVIERKILDMSEILEDMLIGLEGSTLNNADRFLETYENCMRNYESVAEWCVKHGAVLKGLSPGKIAKVYSENLIPRLISDGCSLDLVKQLLQLKAQSESKEIYDRVLLISAMKGRLDILNYLLDQGCKYSSDTIQLALFYASDRAFTDGENIIRKMIS